jgi:glycosyltransferase involved in cell wall biosynthesis
MRIAFYTPRASHLKPGTSGDRIFVAQLLGGLRDRGHEVEVASSVGTYDFWRGRVSARRLLEEARLARGRMKRFSPDAWLVYGASMSYPDVFGWWQRPPRYLLLNTSPGSTERLPARWRPVFELAHRRSLARADAVLAAWPRNADRLRSLGVPEERLGVLPAAVGSWSGVPDQDEARRALDLPAGAPVILCVGRLPGPRADGRPWKTEWVLELLEEVAAAPLPPDALFVHVGDGPGRRLLAERASALGFERRVRLPGSVEHDEIRSYYAACDLFAYVSSSDRPWHVALEAQACGRPVVTLRSSASEMTVAHGQTGVLAASREELRAALGALASDRHRCAAMGRAAREYVRTHHSVAVRVREVERLLLGSDGATPDNEGRGP